MAGRSSVLGSGSVEDRIVLDNVSGPLGLFFISSSAIPSSSAWALGLV